MSTESVNKKQVCLCVVYVCVCVNDLTVSVHVSGYSPSPARLQLGVSAVSPKGKESFTAFRRIRVSPDGSSSIVLCKAVASLCRVIFPRLLSLRSFELKGFTLMFCSVFVHVCANERECEYVCTNLCLCVHVL